MSKCFVFAFAPVVATALATATAPAQKMPLRGDPSRLLQLVEVPEPLRAGADALAPFLRGLVRPPLRDGDDLQVLGHRWIAVLGTPEQAVCVERAVAEAGRQPREFFVDLKAIEVPGAVASALVLPSLGPADAAGVRRMQLDAEACSALLRKLRDAKAEIVQAPKLVAYVRDFQLAARDGKTVVEPVHDAVWNGVRAEVLAAFVGVDRVGCSLSLLDQRVDQPLAEVAATAPDRTGSVGGQVQLQVPHTTSVRLEDAREFAPGDTIFTAAPRADGSWLLAVLTLSPLRER
jgi:hypothetical protein